MDGLYSELNVIDPDINHFEPNVNFQSHSTTSFINKQDIEPSSLKLIHHNARSLMTNGRIDDYGTLLKILRNPFDILVFTETWLTPDKESQCCFKGFRPIHKMRPVNEHEEFKLRGGGISIFIKNNLEFTQRTDLDIMLPYIECLFIEIIHNNQKYIIGGIYRDPDTNGNLFIDKLNSIIEPLKSSHKIILLGDYNIDLHKNDNLKKKIEICLQSNYLIPTILNSTRVASKITNNQEVITKTLIDNIMINYNMKYQSGIIETSITDHYSIYLIVPEFKKTINEPNTFQYRLNNYNCQRKFNFYLKHFGINDVLNNQIAESAYEQFYKIFQDSYDKSFPIKTKTITIKNIQKPWVTETLISKIKRRDNLNKLANKKKIDRTVYTEFRNNLTTELRQAKTNYYEDQFEMNANNTKKTWEVINSVIKSKKEYPKVKLTDEEENYIVETEIPNKFINYFTNIASKLSSEIQPTQHNASSYLPNRIDHTLILTPICPNEVISVIDDLKDNGNKVNTIATSVLVESKHIIAPIICHLIDLFVQQGYFPENLKLGCITPIYKNGNKTKVNNYRPVCSLSPISKIIEKVINNRMVDFLDDHEILSKTQFGFRKNMGTETALMHYIDHLQNELNNKKHAISIFMDLSKAFDVIDHKILETKLKHYGFRGKFLEFLLSFIKDRKYFVHINGKSSETKTVNIGVPQGSTLGPLFFLIFINDMIHCSILLFLSQFADDSTITYSSLDLNYALTKIEVEFKKVLEWLAANKLIINLDKTHMMLFTTSPRTQPISITANGKTINEISETKFLGVMLDNNLCWDVHINYISKKNSKSVSILRMLKHTFPSTALKTLYHSLIYPYFNYCNIIWGCAADTHIEPLILLQKKCTRIISKAGFFDHTEPLLKEHKLLSVTKIYDYNCAKFIHQCHNNNALSYFKNKLIKNSTFHNYDTRNKNSLRKPFIRLHKFTNTFLTKGIDIWNLLPEKIKIVNTLDSFKINAKRFMLDPTQY